MSKRLLDGRRRILAAVMACNAILALLIAWRFVGLRAEWSSWNTAVEAQSRLITRADTAVDPTSRPPPTGPGR